jgi:hypothetical protein
MLLKNKLIYLVLLVFCAVMVLMVYFAYVDHLLLTWEKFCFKTRYMATLIFICCTPLQFALVSPLPISPHLPLTRFSPL